MCVCGNNAEPLAPPWNFVRNGFTRKTLRSIHPYKTKARLYQFWTR